MSNILAGGGVSLLTRHECSNRLETSLTACRYTLGHPLFRRGYAKRRNDFWYGAEYANVSLTHRYVDGRPIEIDFPKQCRNT